jgi:hypothetical protein
MGEVSGVKSFRVPENHPAIEVRIPGLLRGLHIILISGVESFYRAMGECLCEPTPVERVSVAIPRTTAIYRYPDFTGVTAKLAK